MNSSSSNESRIIFLDEDSDISRIIDDTPEDRYTSLIRRTNNMDADELSSTHMPYPSPASQSESMETLAVIRRCLKECERQAEWQSAQIQFLEEKLKEKTKLEEELEMYKQKCQFLEEELKMVTEKQPASHDFVDCMDEQQPQTDESMSKTTVLKLLEIFTCCICNELLIKPGVTNCNHTFCMQCLDKWKAAKKECPVCRTLIKNIHIVKEIDEFITSVMSSTSDEAYAERLQVIEDRNCTNPNLPPTNKSKSSFQDMIADEELINDSPPPHVTFFSFTDFLPSNASSSYNISDLTDLTSFT